MSNGALREQQMSAEAPGGHRASGADFSGVRVSRDGRTPLSTVQHLISLPLGGWLGGVSGPSRLATRTGCRHMLSALAAPLWASSCLAAREGRSWAEPLREGAGLTGAEAGSTMGSRRPCTTADA